MSESENRSVVSDSLRPCGLYRPWNSPGQNTGVGSRSLLQGNLPNPGIKPRSPALQTGSFPAEPLGKPSLFSRTSKLLWSIEYFAFFQSCSGYISLQKKYYTAQWFSLSQQFAVLSATCTFLRKGFPESFPEFCMTESPNEQLLTSPPPRPLQPTSYFVSVCLTNLSKIKGIMQCLSFGDWLISLSTISSRFIHVVGYDRVFFFSWDWIILHCIYIPYFF